MSGRGMAARLLDNEALSQDYELAAPADILRDHVEPYGIQTEGGAALARCPGSLWLRAAASGPCCMNLPGITTGSAPASTGRAG